MFVPFFRLLVQVLKENFISFSWLRNIQCKAAFIFLCVLLTACPKSMSRDDAASKSASQSATSSGSSEAVSNVNFESTAVSPATNNAAAAAANAQAASAGAFIVSACLTN